MKVAERKVELDRSRSADEPSFFRRELRTRLPDFPVGKDIGVRGHGDDGFVYYCKDDARGLPIKATEFVATMLAQHVGLDVAPPKIVNYGNSLLFGSQIHPQLSDEEAVREFCIVKHTNEFGGPSIERARFFGRLFAFDLFIGNPDRFMKNLVAVRERGTRRVLAIDFADASLFGLSAKDWLEPDCRTMRFRTLMQQAHGAHSDSENELLARLESTPVSIIEAILEEMPEGWLDPSETRKFMEFWRDGSRRDRLARLRVRLSNGKSV